MEERIINFTINSDTTPVADPDGKMHKKVHKIFNEHCLNIGFCLKQLKDGTLTVGMKETHLKLVESQVIDLFKTLDFDSVLSREKEERIKDTRALNEENRMLRKLLGEKVSNEDMRERIKNISREIKSWWNVYGFGHVAKLIYDEYGCITLDLSGIIFEADNGPDDKNGSIEDKISYLQNLGFSICKNSETVYASDANIALLTKLIKDKYPSAFINEVNLFIRRGELTIRSIDVRITNLDDLR